MASPQSRIEQMAAPAVRRAARASGRLKKWLEIAVQAEARVAAAWASAAFRRLMVVQWGLPPQPEHFDHRIDLYHRWLAHRTSYWLERGVFGTLTLSGGDVLELACGDGFNTRNFYSLRSRTVVACDFDERAIRTARRFNSAPNVEYVVADIRTEMPRGSFANIVWDAAIEHFTPEETEAVLREVTARLEPGGILSGYTIAKSAPGTKSLSHHEYEFTDKEDLLRVLAPHFEHVTVFETVHPERHNLYFWASDAQVPFDTDWPSMSRSSRAANLPGHET